MVKKAQSEEKEQDEEETKKNAKSLLVKMQKIVFCLIGFCVLGYGAYWVYLNPQFFDKETEQEKNKEDDLYALQISQLQSQVASLQAQLFNLPKPDMSVFEDKVEALEKQMLNVIDSKADAGIALGLLMRIDKLENRLDKVVKISDDGALILSAAMLVKQAAAEGDDFVYEAEILNQLVPENASIKKDVSVIVEFSRNGVVSKKELVRHFKDIYAATVLKANEQSGDWKERLNQKVSEYIKIKKVGEENSEILIDEKWQEMAALVETGKFVKVIKLIESSESDDIKQNQDLQNWLADARNQISFGRAIRNIAAYSLAEMKVNSLKNKD